MKIGKVWIHNFGSYYGQHSVDLADRGLVFVKGDNLDEPKMSSNGAGKSTLFDAVDWCLFGKVPKGDNADSVINLQAKKQCKVTVVVHQGGAGPRITVTRSRKPNKLTLLLGVDEQTTLDPKQTQAKIEELLGLDRDLFLTTVYLPQSGAMRFADATDAEQKRLITRLIPELERCDEIQKKAKTDAAEERDRLGKERAKLDTLVTQIAQLEALAKVDPAEAWNAHREERAVAAYKVLAVLTTEAAELKPKLEALDELEASAQALEMKAYAPLPALAEAQAYKDQVASAGKLMGNQIAVTQRLDEARAQLHSITTLEEGPCPQCGSPLSPQHLARETWRLSEAVSALEAELKRHQEEAQVEESRTAHLHVLMCQAEKDHATKAKSAQQKLSDLKVRIGEQKHIATRLDQMRSQYKQQEKLLHEIAAETPPENKAAVAYDAALQDQAEAEEVIAEIEAQLECLDFWIEGTGAKGIKSYILDSRLQDMTDAANEWVHELTGGTHWVRFESQTMLKSGKLSESISIRVFKHTADGQVIERNYKSWSGGEKQRVALGIDQGLARLLSDRASKDWDTLILDESFRQNIDSGGREALFDLLHKLSEKRSSIYVIDHDNELQSHFENVMRVTIQGGRSTVSCEGEKACSTESQSPKIQKAS